MNAQFDPAPSEGTLSSCFGLSKLLYFSDKMDNVSFFNVYLSNPGAILFEDTKADSESESTPEKVRGQRW